MIKCLECGFEAERLQWTHFKYKCTGRFSNGKEYMEAYPNAIVVDPKLSQRTKLTLENFIIKYGEIDGRTRWDSYREKQAYSNSFEYKRKRHGWTKEQYEEYNSSRASTLEKMIDRYGEMDGARKWINYCDRQAFTNTLQYFIERYGESDGVHKYKEMNIGKGSSCNPVTLANKMNISVEDALAIILSKLTISSHRFGSFLEQEFTLGIEKELGEKLEFTTFTRPYGKWIHSLDSYVIYDIKHLDCVIEFNGDYWHANPKIYTNEALIRGKLATDIRERDRIKMKAAIDNGFRVKTVWESEYNKDKKQTIQEVVKWMQSGQQ
jgi:hypothetical protein